MHTCIHACMHTCMHTYDTYICIVKISFAYRARAEDGCEPSVHKPYLYLKRMCARMYVCVSPFRLVYMCIHTCMYACTLVCLYVYQLTYIHTINLHTQLKKKIESIKDEENHVEKSRIGSYIAVYIPFRDSTTNIVREAVCLIDGSKTGEDKILDFVIAAKRVIKSAKQADGKTEKVGL